jgi:GR25 family glycosyltransferase involved in LPS biosynthesis
MRKLIRLAVLCTVAFALNISATNPDAPPKSPNPLSANEEYIEHFKDLAMLLQLTTNVPASIKLGQALLESLAGESELAMNANNHFGLKCWTCSPTEAYMKPDDEYDKNGQLIYSKFSRFNTAEASYDAHSNRLNTNPKYRSLFSYDRTDYRAWAYGLQKCGYATDKHYAEKLIAIIEKYNLQRFDTPSLLTIPEIGGTATPQYAADEMAVNKPYDSNPNAQRPLSPEEKRQNEAISSPSASKTEIIGGRKVVHNYCKESAYISKEGEPVQFTLYETTLEEAENVMAKNAKPQKQKAVLSQPVQRGMQSQLPK